MKVFFDPTLQLFSRPSKPKDALQKALRFESKSTLLSYIRNSYTTSMIVFMGSKMRKYFTKVKKNG